MKRKKAISGAMCMIMLFSVYAQALTASGEEIRSKTVYEEPTGAAGDNLCEYHPEHDENCGYQEGSLENGCSHAHTEACYTMVQNCVHQHTKDCYPETEEEAETATPTRARKKRREPSECTHVCESGSACYQETITCGHVHDAECGYKEGSEGSPCLFVCPTCQGAENGESASEEGNKQTAPRIRYPSYFDGGVMIDLETVKPDTYYIVSENYPSGVTTNGADSDNYELYYDETNKTLRLRDITLKEGILLDGGITIELIGKNVLNYSSATIQTMGDGDLMIEGSGSLLIEGNETEGIITTGNGDIYIKDAKITVSTKDAISPIYCKQGSLYVSGDAKLVVERGRASIAENVSLADQAEMTVENGTLSASGKMTVTDDVVVSVTTDKEKEAAISCGDGIEITGQAKVSAVGEGGGLNSFTGSIVIEKDAEVFAEAKNSKYSAVSIGQDSPKQDNEVLVKGSLELSGSSGIGSSAGGNIVIDGGTVQAKNLSYIGLTTKSEEDEIIIKNGANVSISNPQAGIQAANGKGKVTIEESTVELNTQIYAHYNVPNLIYDSPYRIMVGENKDSTSVISPEFFTDQLSRSKYVKIMPHQHNYIYHEQIDATNEKTGLKAHYECTICGKLFDENKMETEREKLIIPKTGGEDPKPEVPSEEEKPSASGSGGGGSVSNAGVYYADSSNGSSTALHGSWKQDAVGWWYQNADGTYPAGKWQECEWMGETKWYYFNEQGYMQDGWLKDVDGRVYFLHNVSDNTRGRMYTGWNWIGGKCYFFETQSGNYLGHLYKNTVTPDGNTVNENGEWTVNGVVQTR